MAQYIFSTIYYLSLFYIVLYLIVMCNYAVNHYMITKKEKFWENATDNDILEKAFKIVSKYDKNVKLDNMKEFLINIQRINEYQLEFKIECYKEGIKKRLKSIMSQNHPQH